MALTSERRARAVRVHIEELRLEGFDPRHRYRIADALERELARLVTDANERTQEVPCGGERIDAGAIFLGEGERPEHVGVAIARATFRAMHGQAGGSGRGDRGGGL